QLRKAGSDMSQPHPVEFYLYFADQPSAEAACRELSREGFGARVTKSAPGKPAAQWLCLASRLLVPTEATIAEASRRLEGVTARNHGDYDGWEATVVRPNRARKQ